jgi:hypothetical protein
MSRDNRVGDLLTALKKHFGHKQFKSDLQREATEAVIRSKS